MLIGVKTTISIMWLKDLCAKSGHGQRTLCGISVVTNQQQPPHTWWTAMVTYHQRKRNELPSWLKMAKTVKTVLLLLVCLVGCHEAAHAPHVCDTEAYFECDGQILMCAFCCDMQHNCIDGTDEHGCNIHYPDGWPTHTTQKVDVKTTPITATENPPPQPYPWAQLQVTTIIQVIFQIILVIILASALILACQVARQLQAWENWSHATKVELQTPLAQVLSTVWCCNLYCESSVKVLLCVNFQDWKPRDVV